jgi:hypothetical protein
MNSFRAIRVVCLGIGFLILSSVLSGKPAGEPFIKFDDGYPASPEAKTIKAVGSYDTGGKQFNRIEVWISEQGTGQWTIYKCSTNGNAWLYSGDTFTSGKTYLVEGILYYNTPPLGYGSTKTGIKEVTAQ